MQIDGLWQRAFLKYTHLFAPDQKENGHSGAAPSPSPHLHRKKSDTKQRKRRSRTKQRKEKTKSSSSARGLLLHPLTPTGLWLPLGLPRPLPSPGPRWSLPREGLTPHAPGALGRVTSTPSPTGGPSSSPGRRCPGRGLIRHSFCTWPPRVRTRDPFRPCTPRPGTGDPTSGTTRAFLCNRLKGFCRTGAGAEMKENRPATTSLPGARLGPRGERSRGRAQGRPAGGSTPGLPWPGRYSLRKKSTPAILEFLWETRVDQSVTLSALRVGSGVDDLGEQEGSGEAREPDPCDAVPPLCTLLCPSSPLSSLFLAFSFFFPLFLFLVWRTGEWEAPYGKKEPHSFAEDCWTEKVLDKVT